MEKMKDTIYRQDAIDAFGLSEKTRKYGGDHSGYDTMMLYEIQNTLESLPSAQPDIKQAAKLLLDFIESCPGGDSYLITPNGEELRTDWGYATEGIQLILYWAERRIDEDN